MRYEQVVRIFRGLHLDTISGTFQGIARRGYHEVTPRGGTGDGRKVL